MGFVALGFYPIDPFLPRGMIFLNGDSGLMKPIVKRVLLLGFAAGLLVASMALTASAAEVRVHYQALQKALLQQVFKDGGRHFLYGASNTACQYAYLDQPRVTGSAGRVVIRAQFHGRAGVVMLGECVGANDSFEVKMSGVPVYRNGVLSLDQVRLETAYPLYNDLLSTFVTGTVARALRFPLQAEVQKSVAEASKAGPYQLRVASLDVSSIRTEAQGLAVGLDFMMDIH